MKKGHVSWWLLFVTACQCVVLLCSCSEGTSVGEITKNDSVSPPPAEESDFINETTSTLPSTSLHPQDETTVLPSTTATDRFGPTKLRVSDNCPCDLSSGMCDVNCCCDADCTEEQSKAFSTCHEDVSSEPDLRYCTSRDIFFANRTLFEKRPVGDMFCIFVDNVLKEDVYEDPPNVSSIEDVHELIGKRGSGWEAALTTSHQLPPVRFKAGDSLLLLNEDGTKTEWRLPTQLFTAACEATEAVTYLQDQQFSCQRRVISPEDACTTQPHFSATAYHHAFSVLAAEGKSLPVVPYVCNASCISFNASLHLPYYSNGRCHNIVHKVNYRIMHAGVEGIRSVAVEYTLDAISSSSRDVVQEFRTLYSWHGSSEETWHLSGHPGYVIGLPVLAECFTDGRANCAWKGLEWLTVPTPEDGTCSRSGRRSPLKFGISTRTGCMFSAGERDSCTMIQQAILDSLVGADASFSHVATAGNSNRSVPEEWVPLLEERKPDPKQIHLDKGYCQLASTGIDVYILYARTESGADPQNKIVSVLYRYVGPKAVTVLSTRPTELSFSVSFFDVSKPRVTIFAPPPTIDVRLPYDFFYPFLLDSGARHQRFSDLCIALFLVTSLITSFL